MRERGGVGSNPISTNHTFFLFFLSLPLHQVSKSNHCQHFSAKFKHFSLIDVTHSDWLIF
ncbi:hypothetical protein HanIR_Chr13g0654421 [Helianthus annuus]|nr:hypothetical protein HanIR_Chr13g0654421 [Helianthus annuus]